MSQKRTFSRHWTRFKTLPSAVWHRKKAVVASLLFQEKEVITNCLYGVSYRCFNQYANRIFSNSSAWTQSRNGKTCVYQQSVAAWYSSHLTIWLQMAWSGSARLSIRHNALETASILDEKWISEGYLSGAFQAVCQTWEAPKPQASKLGWYLYSLLCVCGHHSVFWKGAENRNKACTAPKNLDTK